MALAAADWETQPLKRHAVPPMSEICAIIAFFSPKPEQVVEVKDLLHRVKPLVYEE